jgi:transcription termination factor Rho
MVNFSDPEKARKRPHFGQLTPIFPDERMKLETPSKEISNRLVDLFAPIGKGQRALLVSPPKAGKTTLLKNIAHGITTNHPEIILMVLLIDERPEEVTDIARSVDGEIIASTFDRPAEEHLRVANLSLEKAKRLVEVGKDVVLLLDSITRLARASNLVVPPSGRTLSGGMDPAALYFPKRFFGAARNIEEGGSLTIIGTALIDTGSRMDDVIYEEFKGTGNMELHLSRKLSEQRVFPAMDITRSGTRREELLIGEEDLERVWLLRRRIMNVDETGALNLIIDKIKKSRNNEEFLKTIRKS